MKKLLILAGVVAIGFATGCGKNECNELKKAVCDKDAASLACEKAGQLTARDECANYLANLDKFIELSNVVVEEPGVQPP
ncbi:MAG TPA: hypothetical protein PK329_11125, partial [Myxococcota bacterium]|nr:hypothetical protein [Myxococcota bacterium]HPL26201.1 hypothetical protein [Myxococcota bacterium]HQI62613.1 hypothetical protein [Myxococcota bacterium]